MVVEYPRFRAATIGCAVCVLLCYAEVLEQLHYATQVKWLRATSLASYDAHAPTAARRPPELVSLRFLPALKACAKQSFLAIGVTQEADPKQSREAETAEILELD